MGGAAEGGDREAVSCQGTGLKAVPPFAGGESPGTPSASPLACFLCLSPRQLQMGGIIRKMANRSEH